MNEAIIKREAELHIRRWYWSDKSFAVHRVLELARQRPKTVLCFGLFPSVAAAGTIFCIIPATIQAIVSSSSVSDVVGEHLLIAVLLVLIPICFVALPLWADETCVDDMDVLPELPDYVPEDMYLNLLDRTEKWMESGGTICPFSAADCAARKFPALGRVHNFSEGYSEFRDTEDTLRQMTMTMRRRYHALNAAGHVSGDVLELVPTQVAEEALQEFELLSAIADANLAVLDTLSQHTLMNRELEQANKLR